MLDALTYGNKEMRSTTFPPVYSGDPQGSVHGPILFTMFINHLSGIIDSHSIIHQSFADDLQS